MDVKKVASLARLNLSNDELDLYKNQLGAIFKFFEQISEIETTGVEPMVTATEMTQYWRADEVVEGDGAEVAVANAPEKSGHLFKVPPVV